MTVVAIRGHDRVAFQKRGLHADHHRLLPDIEVAEAADQPHAVKLARLLLEAADEQHVAIEFLREGQLSGFANILFSGRLGHQKLLLKRLAPMAGGFGKRPVFWQAATRAKTTGELKGLVAVPRNCDLAG